jgi:hypothetical protein
MRLALRKASPALTARNSTDAAQSLWLSRHAIAAQAGKLSRCYLNNVRRLVPLCTELRQAIENGH